MHITCIFVSKYEFEVPYSVQISNRIIVYRSVVYKTIEKVSLSKILKYNKVIIFKYKKYSQLLC